MLAVNLQYPQAAAILAALGPVRYRFWQTDHRGPLLIHAGRCRAGGAFPRWVEGLAYNAILGVVELSDCVRYDHPGADPDEAGYHWVLAGPRAFLSPLPYNGRQGLFQVADAAVAGALALAVRPGRGAPLLGECIRAAHVVDPNGG